jgi:hypothetical protein
VFQNRTTITSYLALPAAGCKSRIALARRSAIVIAPPFAPWQLHVHLNDPKVCRCDPVTRAKSSFQEELLPFSHGRPSTRRNLCHRLSSLKREIGLRRPSLDGQYGRPSAQLRIQALSALRVPKHCRRAGTAKDPRAARSCGVGDRENAPGSSNSRAALHLASHCTVCR